MHISIRIRTDIASQFLNNIIPLQVLDRPQLRLSRSDKTSLTAWMCLDAAFALAVSLEHFHTHTHTQMGVDLYSWPQMIKGNFSHVGNIICLVAPMVLHLKDLWISPQMSSSKVWSMHSCSQTLRLNMKGGINWVYMALCEAARYALEVQNSYAGHAHVHALWPFFFF